MKTLPMTRRPTFVFMLAILVLGMRMAFNVSAQSVTAQFLIDQLLATENYMRRSPRAKLARDIAKDESISPKIRVTVLKTVLRHELENPCPITHFMTGAYVTPTVYIQKQYVFGLGDIGAEAIPHLKRHLEQLKVSVQNISPSLGDLNSLDVAEMQHVLCALGLLRDKDVFDDVLQLLEDEEVDGYIRQMATYALNKLSNKAAIPALKRALKDDFHVIYLPHSGIPGERRVIYPVRSGACGALKAFGFQFELINDRQQWDYRIIKEPKGLWKGSYG